MATKPNSSPSSGSRAKPKAAATKKPAAAAKKTTPAKKTTARESIRHKRPKSPPTGTAATSKVVKGSERLPEPKDAEAKPNRTNHLHVGAAIARGKKGLLTNEQRRQLARATDGLSPLEFATSVLRDESASQSARQWASEVLMPYMHHRLPTAVQLQTDNRNGGVLVAPSQAMSAEEWIAQYGAQPVDVVDIEFREVVDLADDKDA